LEDDRETIWLVSKFQEAERNKDDILRDHYYQCLLKKYNDLVYFIVRKFDIPPRVGVEDVVSVAKTGLWKGFVRFNPSISKATTYITRIVRGEILKYYRDYCWPWKVSRRFKDAVSGSKDLDYICSKYNLEEAEVIEIQNILKSSIPHEDYKEYNESDVIDDAEINFKEHLVGSLLSLLPEEEEIIVRKYYIDEMSYSEIALDISKDVSFIKKIINGCIEKLQLLAQENNIVGK
jgi:RNA polymerase sigma factor (sigma-70 family)